MSMCYCCTNKQDEGTKAMTIRTLTYREFVETHFDGDFDEYWTESYASYRRGEDFLS